MKPVPKPRRSIRPQNEQQNCDNNNNNNDEINNNNNGSQANNNKPADNKPGPGVVVGIASKFENLTRAGGGAPPAPREISRTFLISKERQNAREQQFAGIILAHFLDEKLSADIKQQNQQQQQQTDEQLESCGSEKRPFSDNIYSIARPSNVFDDDSNSHTVAGAETFGEKHSDNNINDNKIELDNNRCLDENNNNNNNNNNNTNNNNNKSTWTDVSLRPVGRRVGGQSASCRVRVQPRCREAQSELYCSAPTPPPPAPPTKTTNSWPQQQTQAAGEDSGCVAEAMGPSLLERIVTAHPIWFLPELGRTAAVRLLAAQPVGVFVVRGTSRAAAGSAADADGPPSTPGRGVSAMALSVRLPPEPTAEAGGEPVEHYVIESLASSAGGGVRLEGSPFRFRSLPLLLLHYCQRGEELRSRLRLPPAVASCTSLRDLQAVARRGREFWVSGRTTTTATTTTTTNNALSRQQQRQQAEQQQQQTLIDKSKYCRQQQKQQQQQQQAQLFFPLRTDNNSGDNCCHVRDNDNEHENYGVMIENGEMIGSWPDQQQQVQQHMPTTTNSPRRMPAIVMHNPITTMATQQQQQQQQQQQYYQPTDQQQHCCCCNYAPQNDNNYVVPPARANNNLATQQQQQQLVRQISGTVAGGARSKRAVVRTVAPRPAASGQSCWYVGRAGTKPTVNAQQQQQRKQQQDLMSQCVQEPGTSSSGDYQEFGAANAQQTRSLGPLKKSRSAMENINYFSYGNGCDSPPASVSSQASSVRSAAAAGRAPKRGGGGGGGFLKSLFSASNSNLNRTAAIKAASDRPPLDADDYFIPGPSGGEALRDGSLKRRAKTLARRILPSFSSHAPTAAALDGTSGKLARRVSKDDSTHILTAEAITARQLAFRRRNTDLSGASLRPPDGFHYDNNNNNKPAGANDGHKPDGGTTVAWRGGNAGAPLVPPAGRMDERAVRRCIDELRRQRQESEEEAIEPTEDRSSTPQRAATVVLRRNSPRNNNDDYCNNNRRRSVPDSAVGGSDTVANSDAEATTVVADRTAANLRSPAPKPAERTVVIVDECLIDTHIHNEPTVHELPSIRSECVNNENILSANTTELKAPVVVRPQIASGAHEHQKTEMVDVEYSDPSAPPPAVFRHSTRLSRFSAQSGNRNSKIATVRPQQHMIVNSSESSESSSPPETIKSRLRRFSSNSNQSQSLPFGVLKKSEEAEPAKKSTGAVIENTASDVLQRQSPASQTPPKSVSTSSVFHTANNEEDGVLSPPSTMGRRDYAQIGELQQYFASDEYEPTEGRTPTKSVTSANNLGQSFGNNEDDTISVAGTDFNEPWDSNAWCNLLDLARFGDEKPTTAQAIKALHSAETIFEEDDLSSMEELTLRAHLQHHPHGDYFFDDELASNVASEDRFGSLPRSLYSGGSARGGSATGACARRQPVPTARHPNASYQLQQYLNIIPERESGEFGGTSTAGDSGRNNRVSGGTLRSQRASTGAMSSSAQPQQQGESKPASTMDRPASGGGMNVEMEAVAMAAVLGSCGPRPQLGAAYTPEDDGRVSAAAKLSRSVDDHAWRHNNPMHNRTFRYVPPAADDVENRPQKNSSATEPPMNDIFNNNERAGGGDGSPLSPAGSQPQRMKTAGSRLPPHRLKSSSSFSTPLGASIAANRPSATSVTASTLRVGGGSVGDASSMCTTRSYGHRHGGGELTRDTQSLHRMPHNDDLLHSSLNNLSVRLTAMSPIIAPARFRNAPPPDVAEPSVVLQRFVEQLASDDSTLFGGTLHKFIECTVESEEADPHVVIRRVRQFLNGMKNYLVKNGQGGLHALIERESAKLHANEFLNIDVIFETVLTKIVLVPIKGHLYHLMVFENTRNGDLQRLSENLSAVRAMDPAELGFPTGTVMPDAQTMEQVRAYMRRMQNHYSPLKKLENLLKALSLAVTRSLSASTSDTGSIGLGGGRYAPPMRSQSGDMLMDFGGGGTLDSRASSSTAAAAYRQPPHSTPLAGLRHAGEHFLRSSNKHQSTERLTARVDASGAVTLSAMAKRLPSEELIRWMVYLLAKSSAINCEIEAWYMWELLPQQMVTNGEAEYYLSMFFTAVNMLKKPESIRRLKRHSRLAGGGDVSGLSSGGLSTLPEDGFGSPSYSSDSFMRIAVPNEQEGSISYHIFPVLPQMNVVKLCRVIAHQFAVTNPEDYGLYVLYDNFETILLPKEFPQAIHDRLIEDRKMHLFVYKRRETRIAWPKNAYACCMPAGDEEDSLLAQ